MAKVKYTKRTIAFCLGVIFFITLAVISFKLFLSDEKISITYLTEGGETYETQKIKAGTRLIPISGPEIEGYVFEYWLYEDGSLFDASKAVNSDIVLKPSYKMMHIVTFLTEDGTEFYKTSVADGTALSRPPSLPRTENRRFSYWKLGDSKYNFDFPVKEDMTLTASMREYVKAQSLSFAKSSYEVYCGVREQITAAPNPSNSTERIKYQSSDNNVFTVDENGNIRGLKIGNATLTAAIEDITAETTIVVREIYPYGIESAVGDKIEMKVDEVRSVSAVIYPYNASNRTVYYSVDNAAVAYVTSLGVITACGEGECKITMSTINGISCTVDLVVYKGAEEIDLQLISGAETLSQADGSPCILEAFPLPEGTKFSKLEWKISDEECVQVEMIDNSLVITPLNVGEDREFTVTAVCDGIESNSITFISLYDIEPGEIPEEKPET